MLSRIRFALALAAFFAVLSYGSPGHAGTLTFCFKWNYSFVDGGYGEDNLRHPSGQSYGRKEAAYALAHVARSGSTVAHNVLNSSGCLAPIPRVAGTYTISISPAVYMPNGTLLDVQRTETSGLEFFTRTTYYPGGGDLTSTNSFGNAGDPVANAMAVAVQFAKESHIGISSNQDYTIIASSSTMTGYGGGTVFIGANDSPSGGPDAQWKYVIAHELGHAVQDRLFGTLDKNYNGHSSSNQLCNCSHVDTTHYPLNQAHCLQSRETIEAVQNEGFAHFVALDAMNNDSDLAKAVFVYYKGIRDAIFNIRLPPNGVGGRTQYKWMRTYCNTSTPHVGIEIDWMNFYYAVHTAGGSANFSYNHLRDIYLDTCGGSTCDGLGASNGPKWNGLTAAVGARYGSSSARLDHWNAQGAAYGVNQ